MTNAHATADQPLSCTVGRGKEQSDAYGSASERRGSPTGRSHAVVRIVEADQPEPAPILNVTRPSTITKTGGRMNSYEPESEKARLRRGARPVGFSSGSASGQPTTSSIAPVPRSASQVLKGIPAWEDPGPSVSAYGTTRAHGGRRGFRRLLGDGRRPASGVPRSRVRPCPRYDRAEPLDVALLPRGGHVRELDAAADAVQAQALVSFGECPYAALPPDGTPRQQASAAARRRRPGRPTPQSSANMDGASGSRHAAWLAHPVP